MELNYSFCDLHSHILPGMDDGCQSVAEAVQLLRASYEQGIRKICATPHYYPVESVEEFLVRRDAAQQELYKALEKVTLPVPQLCMGAEVAYRPGICYQEDLNKLCIGKSQYLLLEMPFHKWGEEVIRTVRGISNVRGITPILAHIERYLPMQDKEILERLLDQEILVQMNAARLLRFSSRGQARRLLNNGTVQLLGSDCHNNTSRPQNLAQAVQYLQKKGMEDVLEDISRRSRRIFREATGEKKV